MSNVIVKPKDKSELIIQIKYSITRHGTSCDLNHIDTSLIDDMSYLFSIDSFIHFNGDISSWNTSNVVNMVEMFKDNKRFNRDISQWDTSNVISMHGMFRNSNFNQDISTWKLNSLEDMSEMFMDSQFSHNIKNFYDVLNGFIPIDFKDVVTNSPLELNNPFRDILSFLYEFSIDGLI